MKRAIIIAAFLACSCRAQDAAAWWGALAAGVSTSPINPMSSYARPNNIIGFWHCQHSGGVGIKRTNLGSNSNRWEDLTSYNHPIMLSDFRMNSTNGWSDDGSLVRDQISGICTGTLANITSTNMTVMVVVKSNSSKDVNVFTSGSCSIFMGWVSPYDWTTYEGYYPNDNRSRSSSQAITNNIGAVYTGLFQSWNTNDYFASGFYNFTQNPVHSSSAKTIKDIVQGNFGLGNPTSHKLKVFEGRIYMLAIWNEKLSGIEITNNVLAAKQQFGF